jgi:anti-anti-sigma factor
VCRTCRVFRTDPRSLDEREEHHRARFGAFHHLQSATTLVTVEGEVDATNGRSLAVYVERQLAGSARLTLDLTQVDFFGTAGFAALHNINVICCRYGVEWMLMVQPQVRRLLEICDPGGTLPVVPSTVENAHAGAGDRELLVGGNH